MALQQPEEISQPTPEQSYLSTAKCYFGATDDPAATDDASEGYAPNSFWYRTDSNQTFQCVDNTDGAAVWNEIGTHSTFLKIGNVIRNSPTVNGLLYVGASNTLQSSPAIGASQSIRRNAGNTAFEAFTPLTGITIGQAIGGGGANRVLYEDGSQNLGASADFLFDSSNNRLTVGSAKLQTPNSTSLFLGTAPHASYSGSSNVFVGLNAGGGNTGQYQNTYVGSGAGAGTSGDAYFNTFIGYNAGTVATGRDNTFLGNNAGAGNTSGFSNVFIGSGTGSANTSGSYNTFVGESAGGANTTGGSGVAVGYRAGYAQAGGTDNIFIGVLAGAAVTTGNYNTFLGRSGSALVSGSHNTLLGFAAGDLVTGGSNTMIGRSAGSNVTSGSDNVMIGFNVQADSATASNQTNINNTFVATSTQARISGRDFKIEDGKNIVFDTTTGTKIGTSSTQKIGFFGATPVAQRTNLGAFIDNSGGDNTTTTFNDPGASYNQTYWKDFVASVVKFMDATSNHFQDLGLTA